MGLLQRIFGMGKSPVKIERTDKEQAAVDQQTANLSLYHFDSCPFCQRARAAITSMGLNIELRDIRQDAEHRDALMAGGGKTQVPCLRIEGQDGVEWLYESGDIAAYLQEQFAA